MLIDHVLAAEQTRTATHCPYCAFQCGIYIAGPREEAKVTGDATFPVNNDALCVKGWTAAEALNYLDRLLTPLARNARGLLVPVTWDDALARVARGLSDAQAHYGRDAAAILAAVR